MDLEQLTTLLAAVEEGSLSAAARRRHLTQPAVSLQMKALEEELGTRVLHRQGRGVTPTEAGDALVARAREILGAVHAARAEVAAVAGVERGTLRLGVTDAAATEILPLAFAAYHRRHPGIELRVDVQPTAGVVAELLAGRLDLGVGTLPEEDGLPVAVRFLQDERLGFVLPPGSGRLPLARVLESTPFIAYPRDSTTRRLIDSELRRAGLRVRPTMEIGRPDVMIRLVEAGLGAAVLPRSVTEAPARSGSVRRPPFRRFAVVRRLGLLWPEGRTLEPAARAFAALLGPRTVPGSERTARLAVSVRA